MSCSKRWAILLGLGGLLPAGCVMPPAHSALAGPDKPVGVNSLALPADALCVMIEKCKNAVVTPVPKPGGFSGSNFRYTMQRTKTLEVQAQNSPSKAPGADPAGSNGPTADANIKPSA